MAGMRTARLICSLLLFVALAAGCAAPRPDRPPASPASAAPASPPAPAVPAAVTVPTATFEGKPFTVRSVLLFADWMSAGVLGAELQVFDQPVDCDGGRRALESKSSFGEALGRIRVSIRSESIEGKVITTGIFMKDFSIHAVRTRSVIVSAVPGEAAASHARGTVRVAAEDGSGELAGELSALRCP
jgi:hypothetical protein